MSSNRTIYFAYGSNMCIDQMRRRCPDHEYVGIGLLDNWRWIINQRGVANVVPYPGDYVYGLLYKLSPSDEKSLDGSEGFPNVYQKVIMPIKLTRTTSELSSNDETAAEVTTDAESNVTTMVYISFPETISANPREEYVPRMERAVSDALRKGIPQSYLSKYIIPGLIKRE